jgi:RNA polymerase sigma-70 factor (ECF subfamily)
MNTVLPVRQLLEQRRLVFGFIHALTRDVDASEEIFQEVSVAILEEGSKGTVVDHFLPWALGIARHRVGDYYRKRGRSRPVSETLADTVVAAFEQNAETPEDAARRIRGLLDCVDRLPPRQRQILELRYRDRQPVSKVAAGVGWKAEAVKVALSKIRKALLHCLQEKNLIEGADAG